MYAYSGYACNGSRLYVGGASLKRLGHRNLGWVRVNSVCGLVASVQLVGWVFGIRLEWGAFSFGFVDWDCVGCVWTRNLTYT